MKEVLSILNKTYSLSEHIKVSIMDVIILVVVLIFATFVLRTLLRVMSRNLPYDDKKKFKVVFSYAKWLVYVIIILITFHSLGINVTGIFAASAALLIGIGLALQTLFQDIISGVFILIDQSVHVDDIIEIDGKVGRVEEIKLRTTRAITIDNKVLIIPNHLYLSNCLYNWTQNDINIRESVAVGVAYESDVQLVKKLLLQAVNSHPNVIKEPEAIVLFMDFADSSLNFKVSFTLANGFNVQVTKSDIRFEINKLFRAHNINMPFPQRDIHIIQKPEQNVNLKN